MRYVEIVECGKHQRMNESSEGAFLCPAAKLFGMPERAITKHLKIVCDYLLDFIWRMEFISEKHVPLRTNEIKQLTV